ncbi:hypothetical protein MIR68_006324 [Amoeboaphelidium protococcarum]|nr:hypothetical protein MIR68_006324 [Amoeboaphelidium protococcarum]
MLNVTVLSSNNDIQREYRVDPAWTLQYLKNRLQLIVGCDSQSVKLKIDEGPLLNDCEHDPETLHVLGIVDGSTIEITTPINQRDNFTDVSQVEKFELDDAEYEKRTDSVRNFMRVNKLGKHSDQRNSSASDDHSNYESFHGHVGDRCQVQLTEDGLKRNGYIRYVGNVNGRQGLWIGVEYDEPVGRHDGSFKGVTYFQCKHGHGSFVAPDKVHLNGIDVDQDEDLFASSEDEI